MNIVIQKKNAKSTKNIAKLNNAINKGDDVFLFINADWCGHCKTVKPEWAKLYKTKYGPSVVIANVNSELYKGITNFGPDVEGFPDLRYINKAKGITEKFENSKLPDTNRTFNAFVQWIKSKTSNKNNTNKNNTNKHNFHKNKYNTKKHVRGMVYGGSRRRGKNNTRKTRTSRKI
jgi:thiol-disulfide isomerase/thioredoxin